MHNCRVTFLYTHRDSNRFIFLFRFPYQKPKHIYLHVHACHMAKPSNSLSFSHSNCARICCGAKNHTAENYAQSSTQPEPQRCKLARLNGDCLTAWKTPGVLRIISDPSWQSMNSLAEAEGFRYPQRLNSKSFP